MVLWIEPPDLYTYLTTARSKFLFYAALCYAESALQIADCTMQHCRVVAVEPTGKELLRCLQSKERLWANYFFLVIKFVLRSVRATAVAVGINQTKEEDSSSAGWPQLISNLPPTHPLVTEMAQANKTWNFSWENPPQFLDTIAEGIKTQQVNTNFVSILIGGELFLIRSLKFCQH